MRRASDAERAFNRLLANMARGARGGMEALSSDPLGVARSLMPDPRPSPELGRRIVDVAKRPSFGGIMRVIEGAAPVGMASSGAFRPRATSPAYLAEKGAMRSRLKSRIERGAVEDAETYSQSARGVPIGLDRVKAEFRRHGIDPDSPYGQEMLDEFASQHAKGRMLDVFDAGDLMDFLGY